MRRLSCVVAGIVLVTASGCGEEDAGGALPSAPATTTTQAKLTPGTGASLSVGQPSAGRTVFETKCEVCHKLSDAEVGAGPRLVGANLTEEAIKNQVAHPRDAMPPNLVSGTDLDDVAAFILQQR